MAVNEISGFLKFKDTNGDTNLLLPITTKDNVDGLDEIENELADAVKVTTQSLSDDQKATARENIDAAPAVHNAGVGQTIIVKAVDENGKPTEWEAVEYQPRTHYEECVELVNGAFEYSADDDMFMMTSDVQFVEGQTYQVTYNGADYSCVAKIVDGLSAIGNLDHLETGEPFIIVQDSGVLLCIDMTGATEATVRILGPVVHKLDAKYLPVGYPYQAYVNIISESTVTIEDTHGEIVGTCEFVPGQIYTIMWNGVKYESEAVEVDGIGCIGDLGVLNGNEPNGQPFIIIPFSDEGFIAVVPLDGSTEVTVSVSGLKVQKMDSIFIPDLDFVKNILDGSAEGSIRSVGSKPEDKYTIGIHAVALGSKTTASGDYSHAEGYNATASGDYSHAEGNNTTASGTYSHAEGSQTTASGTYSHAEGFFTRTYGTYSHAEGIQTIASGNHSHAEGCDTKASGDNSHVQGKYNVEDTANKYAHIVGNGDNQNARSNAHTLDWDGNGWFKGGLKVGGNSQDDKAAREVAFKDEVDLLKDAGVLLKDEVDLLKDEAVGKRVEGQIFTVDGESVTAKSGAEIFNNYSYNIATGQDSHAEGSNTTASGYYSHAEGSNTTASGYYSHAEGSNTTASGSRSHAEGSDTTASGNCSHAEGAGTEASGEYSHAEGSNTTASGKASHAEGYNTTASGEASHAEGFRTEASGNWSHVEGYRTKASGEYQHVQGTYNVEDTVNKYAHIVGNGSKDSDNIIYRSNAHTLDWDGNGWFQGDVYVGSTSGTNRDEGSKKLATESYADIVATNAADAVKNDLLNGAGAAYDTLKELGELIDGNQDAIDALETVASSKADKDHSHDWETIENRPFGEVPGADTVYWDGNREGLVKADGYDRYMVSTATPTLADFENGASNTKLLSGTESTSNLGMGTAIYEAGDGCIVVGNTIVALKDGATLGDEVYPKKGTYFTWIGNDSYTTRLTINGYTGFLVTKKIDPQWLPNHFHNLGPAPVVTSGDGAAYTVTIDGVTELYNGLQFLMLPHTNSTTTAVTLNVNGLGAKTIRQRMGTNTSIGVAGATANWIVANKPITVTYNGSTWMVEIERPDAANIYGTVAVKSGGTGKASVTAGNFLVGNGTEAMVEKTPSEVLSLINGVSNDEFTNKVNELIDTKMASITNAEEVAF